jgi:hypothetical protein
MLWGSLIQLALPLMTLLLLPVLSFAVCASCVSWIERIIYKPNVLVETAVFDRQQVLGQMLGQRLKSGSENHE